MKHIFGLNSKSVLTNVQDQDIQPNAVDLRLDRVFKILPTMFELSENHKVHRQTQEILPDEEGYLNLEVGDYEAIMANTISVSDTEAGWVITRSTLNRSNIFITSGLYDSKYSGCMAGCLHVGSGPAKIQKGTRIAQYLNFDAEALYGYSGSYGFGTDGTPKADEVKYHS